jgi:hypothetical protein
MVIIIIDIIHEKKVPQMLCVGGGWRETHLNLRVLTLTKVVKYVDRMWSGKFKDV